MNSMTILIVEDQSRDRSLLRAILEAEGHATIEAGDGIDALALLESTSVDAIISDIFMPRMDGYRFCREVRRSPHLRELSFIFYSAMFTEPSHQKLGIEVGADDYLTKPAAVPVILKALADAQQKAALRRGMGLPVAQPALSPRPA